MKCLLFVKSLPLRKNEAIKLNLKCKSEISNGINLAVVSITQIIHCHIVLVLEIMQSNVHTGWWWGEILGGMTWQKLGLTEPAGRYFRGAGTLE